MPKNDKRTFTLCKQIWLKRLDRDRLGVMVTGDRGANFAGYVVGVDLDQRAVDARPAYEGASSTPSGAPSLFNACKTPGCAALNFGLFRSSLA
jgi:hypothetical protein